MQAFLNDFDVRNPFATGGRHAFMLKLGRYARYKGFSPEEMRLLQKTVVEKYAQADFGSGEIEKTLKSFFIQMQAPFQPLFGSKGPRSILWDARGGGRRGFGGCLVRKK